MRARIAAANYYTKVWTGTFGVSQLRDANGVLHEVYLYRDANNNEQLPVPLYFYKVILRINKSSFSYLLNKTSNVFYYLIINIIAKI